MTSSLARDLSAIVGERHVREARAERLTYSMDGLPTHRRVPDVVVLPGTREELIAVVRLLAAHGVPFVPRGAGTGLSGGALADEGTVLLVLTRLNRIVRVDRDNRLAVVEPGVVNAKLGAAARPHGLQYAPDPSSQSACTIGGNVAENSGGPHCLKYGVTANHVLALEMMDQSCIRAVEDSVYAAGYPRDAAAVLLVEIDGGNADAVVAETDVVADLLRKSGARSVRTAASEAERERLWQGRKKAFGAMGRLSRDLLVQDAVVPRSALPQVLETISDIAQRYGLVVSNVFHAGDGNLHPNISFDASDPALKQRVEAASAEIMATCIAAGGTITGEHGVGIDKLRYMPLIFDAESLGAMHAVRKVFDPDERVNPGKVVPVHACREWASIRNAKFGMRNDNAGFNSAFHISHSALEPVR